MHPHRPNANDPPAAHDANAPSSVGPPTARGASNARLHPDEWVTGDSPMTAAQASLLLTLSEEAGQPFDSGLSKADASMRIEALQKLAGRGHPKRILEEDQTDG